MDWNVVDLHKAAVAIGKRMLNIPVFSATVLGSMNGEGESLKFFHSQGPRGKVYLLERRDQTKQPFCDTKN